MELGYNFDNEIEYNCKDRKKPFRIIRGVVVSFKLGVNGVSRLDGQAAPPSVKGVKSRPFMIPKGFTSDGCSIPKGLRFLLGCPHTPEYVPASIIHDYLLENPEIVRYDRKTASTIFFHALLKEGVCPLKAVIMFLAVDIWQWVKNLWTRIWV